MKRTGGGGSIFGLARACPRDNQIYAVAHYIKNRIAVMYGYYSIRYYRKKERTYNRDKATEYQYSTKHAEILF